MVCAIRDLKMKTMGAAEIQDRVNPRALSPIYFRVFVLWSAFFWGFAGVMMFSFYFGWIDFLTSTKAGLYGISIWLNGWILALFEHKNDNRSKFDRYHDCLVLWMCSYCMTNLIWELPWLFYSGFGGFKNFHTIDDIIAQTDYMRESPFHLYWWMVSAFGSVDLRTVNHNSTFFTLELYSFINLIETFIFFHLNKKKSHYRYLIPVISNGAPAMATFIFSFSEVFNNYENMAGGTADTLLALVWTQYQFILFPIIFGYWGFQMFEQDWKDYYFSSNNSSVHRYGSIGEENA